MERIEIAVRLLAAHLSRGNGQYTTNDGLLSNAHTLEDGKFRYDRSKHKSHINFLADTAIAMAQAVMDAEDGVDQDGEEL